MLTWQNNLEKIYIKNFFSSSPLLLSLLSRSRTQSSAYLMISPLQSLFFSPYGSYRDSVPPVPCPRWSSSISHASKRGRPYRRAKAYGPLCVYRRLRGSFCPNSQKPHSNPFILEEIPLSRHEKKKALFFEELSRSEELGETKGWGTK